MRQAIPQTRRADAHRSPNWRGRNDMSLPDLLNCLISRPERTSRKRRSSRTGPLLELLEDRTLLASLTGEPGVEIAIRDTGFQPDSVTIVAGRGVHWTNESAGLHSVTSNSGWFDSGTLPAQSGYSMALA